MQLPLAIYSVRVVTCAHVKHQGQSATAAGSTAVDGILSRRSVAGGRDANSILRTYMPTSSSLLLLEVCRYFVCTVCEPDWNGDSIKLRCGNGGVSRPCTGAIIFDRYRSGVRVTGLLWQRASYVGIPRRPRYCCTA